VRRVRTPRSTNLIISEGRCQFVTEALSCAPRRAAQGGKLPLHYAAAKNTSLEVVKLLLNANLDAIKAADKVTHA
jgi:ankyrin repeat protein